MKQTGKRLLSTLLVLVMVLTMLPATVFAADLEMTLRISEVSAVAGSTVTVKLDLEDNPGVSGMRVKVAYGDILSLTDVSYNGEMGGQGLAPQSFASPFYLAWSDQVKDFTAQNCTFATLTFDVSEEAMVGDSADIVVTYDPDDVYNVAETNITLNVINGSVTIMDCVPGDINGDGKLNMKDQSRLFQYLVGWEVEVNEPTLDTNGDGSVNMKDQSRLFQYLVGWNVELFPKINKPCEHERTHIEQQNATCTEDGIQAHWYCAVCEKYFVSETGNSTMETTIIPALGHKEVTFSEPGYTDGIKCETCGEIIVESAPIGGDVYNIEYDLYDNDSYLKTLKIDNPNPNTYFSEIGLTLDSLEVDGYRFLGWVDGYGDSVRSIPAGSTGNKKLYAKWMVDDKSTYTVHFVSEGEPIAVEIDNKMVSTVTKSMNESLPLPEAEMQGYVFLCWTDGNNNIVNRVNAGSRGELTLYANWTSERNQTRAVKELGKPVVVEDDENGQLLFIYEIGEIINVPLQVLKNYGNVLGEGLTWTKTVETSTTITSSQATTIANTIAEATTLSSAWSLSEDWNESATCDTEHSENKGREEVETIRDRVASGENWNISSSNGGSSSYTKNSGSSTQSKFTLTTGKVSGVEANVGGSESSTENSQLDLGIEGKVSNSTTVSASANVGVELPGVGKAGAETGVSNTTSFELGGHVDYTKGWSTTNEKNWGASASESKSSGAEGSIEGSSYSDESSQTTSTWNSTNGYGKSQEVSREDEISSAVSQEIYDKFGYSSTTGHNTSKSETGEASNSSSSSREYSTTAEYSLETKAVETSSITNDGAAKGWYRLVTAGTVHVFAVVGYDIATNSYYTYTYNVIDDERYEFFDYSLDDPSFSDRENGVLPFEVPYEVHEIVNDVIKQSKGLTIDTDTGMITKYTGTAEAVFVPDYISVDNGDGTFSAVKVTGFAANVFQNNKTIKAVKLGRYITNIPDGAFKGCTNLEMVVGYGMEEIGAEAFSGCTSIAKFKVSDQITKLGNNAFKDVAEITVTASDTAVAEAAINSGAKRISLYLTSMTNAFGAVANNRVLTVPEGTEYFALYGGRKTTLKDTVLKSYADETVLNGVTFDTDSAMVLELASNKVTLVATSVSTDAVALHLPNANTEISLQGANTLVSGSEIAVISKNAAYRILNKSVASTLNITGDMLVCGTFTEEEASLVNVTGDIRTITEAEYQAAITSHTLTFDPNGGTVNSTESSKKITMGQPYGTLPTPTRTGYNFDGWYTAKTGGEKVTASTICSAVTNVTVYAHWSVKAYTASWSNVTGCTIAVKRTSSPYAGAATGTLSTGAAVYYGDVLSITYTPGTAYNLNTKGSTSITVTGNVTSSHIYATTTVKSYKLSWSTATGCTITVKRTSSPYAGAATGTCSSGGTIYYGDVLSITYAANTGYSLATKGSTSITVTGNVTSSNIYATATPNSYTYNIVYKSSNGTSLGSTTATYKYGTTNTISPKSFTDKGYTSPAAQSVKWDSTSAKTITFTYTPASVGSTTQSGNFMDSGPKITYSTKMSWRNRTATSVEVKFDTTATIQANWYGFAHGIAYNSSCGSTSMGKVTVAKYDDLYTSSVAPAHSSSGSSSWVKIPLSTTNKTTLSFSTYMYQINYYGTDLSGNGYSNRSMTWTMNIPAY